MKGFDYKKYLKNNFLNEDFVDGDRVKDNYSFKQFLKTGEFLDSGPINFDPNIFPKMEAGAFKLDALIADLKSLTEIPGEIIDELEDTRDLIIKLYEKGKEALNEENKNKKIMKDFDYIKYLKNNPLLNEEKLFADFSVGGGIKTPEDKFARTAVEAIRLNPNGEFSIEDLFGAEMAQYRDGDDFYAGFEESMDVFQSLHDNFIISANIDNEVEKYNVIKTGVDTFKSSPIDDSTDFDLSTFIQENKKPLKEGSYIEDMALYDDRIEELKKRAQMGMEQLITQLKEESYDIGEQAGTGEQIWRELKPILREYL